MEDVNRTQPELRNRLTQEQLHTHYKQLPAVIIAPAMGAVFTAWVLWDAVNSLYLQTGLAAVIGISTLRIFIYKWYFSSASERNIQKKWRWISISTALISGCIWGSAAIFLYPPLLPEYEVYMLVLLALIPVAPVAALAVYMPAFYAYYIPCTVPFILTLGLQDSRAELMTAVLLMMMMGATLTFAKKYSSMLSESILLHLQLADKKQELEKAAVVKTQFLASASHDLRQPVHAIGLFVEALHHKFKNIESRKLLNNIEEAILNLRIMLEGMLDISRLDAKVVEVNRRNFNTENLLDSLRDEYGPQIIQKGLSFHYFSPGLIVNSDPILLERILRNLLSNAIKYTLSGGILLGCRWQHGKVRILICDTGSGIPTDQLDDIFLEFTQLDNAERNAKKGLGLGLSIVKRLCHLLDHEINVSSRPGKGSTFSVLLPAANDLPLTLKQQSNESRLNKPLPKHFLAVIIDDNETIRKAMRSLIKEWGGHVITSTSAQEALPKILQLAQTPDLLLVDYRLARDSTAIDAIAELKPVTGKNTATIIITGDTSPARIREAHQHGYLLLHKPVDPRQLKISIIELLDSAES